MVTYEQTVMTGDVPDAGTTSKVAFQFLGMNGESQWQTFEGRDLWLRDSLYAVPMNFLNNGSGPDHWLYLDFVAWTEGM